ncbi:SigB/SigF/SigG family RNA polymerase sigma factor [Mycolicibacterium sp. XJ879]
MSALLQTGERIDPAQRDDDYADVSPMCNELRNTSDHAKRRRLRARIISRCLPLADHIALRFAGRGESAEDLAQVARLGLIKAVDRYEPDRGPFLPYAVPTIMGEVRRHFRDHTWGVHVPRSIKDLHQRVSASIGLLSQRLGRAPTASEVAADLDVDREDVVRAVDMSDAYRPQSLDAAPSGSRKDRPAGAAHGATDPRYDSVEDALTVADLVGRLTERQRLILRLRFCDDLPQSKIGERLGVSQVQVSRLLAATLERLREYIHEDDAVPPAR